MYEATIQSQVEIVTSEKNHVRSYNIVTGRDCDKLKKSMYEATIQSQLEIVTSENNHVEATIQSPDTTKIKNEG